ncbi:endonuclease V [Candidatus Woesearchaeota archaeon]|nr:endonuclease V [Candidatus Woesearchaeota archaeon]
MRITELKKEQIRLAKKVTTKDEFAEIKRIAGCDQAFVGNQVISAVVVLTFPALEVLEKKFGVADAPIPYVPGFRSYREAPAVVEAFGKLKEKPDMLLCDAHGILHERRIGMASHLGILLDVPTIGISTNLLVGEVRDDKIYVENELRGMLLKTKEYAKPIYVSPGHRVSLKSAVEIVQKCLTGHKLPEPIHQAHKFANRLQEQLSANKQTKQTPDVHTRSVV